MMACVGLPSESDRTDVLSNYQTGGMTIAMELDAKLLFWSNNNPHVMAGMASDDAVDALRCAHRAHTLWLASPEQGLEHDITLQVFAQPAVHDEFQLFLNGPWLIYPHGASTAE